MLSLEVWLVELLAQVRQHEERLKDKQRRHARDVREVSAKCSLSVRKFYEVFVG